MEKNDDKRKPNKFVRVLIIFLCLLILVLILYNFFGTAPRGEINASIIGLLAILVVIALSESFDNFSIAKLIEISRESKRKDTSINRLGEENRELRNQIVQVATSISQSQTSTIISGLPLDLLKRLGVEKASEDEIKEKQSEESASTGTRVRHGRKGLDFRKVEELAIGKFLAIRKLENYNIIKEAKLVTQFHGIDPISNIQPIFDGYINTGDEEIFIEVRPITAALSIWRERIYVMLNKIHLYRSLKRTNAHLALIMVHVPSVRVRNEEMIIQRFLEFFSPAMASNLLRTTVLVLSNIEEESIMRE
jgi:hypothetical protein